MGNSQNNNNAVNTSPEHNKINSITDSDQLLAIELVKQSYDTYPAQERSFESEERAKMLANVLSTDQMIRVALHLSQRTYTGFYSISFNQVARGLDSDFIQAASQWNTKDYMPEIYDNPDLTLSEKDEFEKCYNRELNALSNAFKTASDSHQPKFFRDCEDCNIPDDEMDDLYSQCYNQICIRENLKATQSLQDASQSTFSSPVENQIIVDHSPYGDVLWTYYLPTKDLLMAVIKDQKNPLIGTPLSPVTIERVKYNFPTELKLIEYGLDRNYSLK